MERNLYPVFDVNLFVILWNTAILRHDSVSRPIDPFHVYVNEVELEDKTITRSDV